MVRWRLSGQFRPMAEVTRAGSNGFDVTPAFHPPATRDGPLLSRRSTGEATGGFKPARCLSSWAAVDRYLIGSTVCKTSQSFASLRGGGRSRCRQGFEHVGIATARASVLSEDRTSCWASNQTFKGASFGAAWALRIRRRSPGRAPLIVRSIANSSAIRTTPSAAIGDGFFRGCW